jgi:hypothetical protein
MRGGKDDPKVGAEAVGEIRDTRRGQDPNAQHVDAGARQPGDNSGLEEFTGGAGVAPHHGDRPMAFELSYIAKDMCGRHGEIESQLSRQILIGDPAYPIGAEEMSQRNSLVACASCARQRSTAWERPQSWERPSRPTPHASPIGLVAGTTEHGSRMAAALVAG